MLSDRDVHVERATFTSNPARRQRSPACLPLRCLVGWWMAGGWMDGGARPVARERKLGRFFR